MNATCTAEDDAALSHLLFQEIMGDHVEFPSEKEIEDMGLTIDLILSQGKSADTKLEEEGEIKEDEANDDLFNLYVKQVSRVGGRRRQGGELGRSGFWEALKRLWRGSGKLFGEALESSENSLRSSGESFEKLWGDSGGLWEALDSQAEGEKESKRKRERKSGQKQR